MPKRLCKCGHCEYCSAYSTYQADLEFGRRPSADTRKDRVRNFLHLQHTEEMCDEFGTGGSTFESRKKANGDMPVGTELIDSLLKQSFED